MDTKRIPDEQISRFFAQADVKNIWLAFNFGLVHYQFISIL
ncbi:hypothetical protein [Nodularia sp. NIES-3585]|nr:hypothetical protein [Nodularia sp. NIES-3585]